MRSVFVVVILSLSAAAASADVIALYNFDGRIHSAAAVRRDNVDGPLNGLESGPDYVPRAKAGELGPALSNPFGGAHPSYYRSLYDDAGNREALLLSRHHGMYFDSYIAAADVLPASGPMTVEMIFRLDSAASGTVLFDMSSAEGANTLEAVGYSEIQPVWTLCHRVGKEIVLKSKPLEAGRYYQLTLGDDGVGGLSLFVDGELAANAKLSKVPARSPRFAIARRVNGKGSYGYLTGAFDAIVIHNSAATPAEFKLKIK